MLSRYGRVNYVLQQRLELLGEVNRLQKSLDADGDVASTCETAAYFFLYQVSGQGGAIGLLLVKSLERLWGSHSEDCFTED
jgi:hypothetical protein